MDLLNLSVKMLADKIRRNELKARNVCEFYLQRIQKINPNQNSFLQINEKALEKAEQLDTQKEKRGQLFGVPIAVKDNFCVKGMRATAASKILHNFAPPYTAFCVEQLENEGAIVIGKNNLDEFAMGSSTENSAYSHCQNPWDSGRVPGGSSGGSAASTASRLAPVAIGSDTGGSIRQPASFCGVVGIKPTYGLVSRNGMIAFASSLDQAGSFGNSVEDAAIALDCMIKKDPIDATNVHYSNSLLTKPGKKISEFIFGLPKQYFVDDLNSEVRDRIKSLTQEIKKCGARVVEVDLPHTKYAIPVYYLVASSEASSNLSRYDGVRYGLRESKNSEGMEIQDLVDLYKETRSKGFGEEVKRRILLGTFSLSSGYCDAYYKKACQVRRLIRDDFKDVFKKCDILLSPVSTSTAFKRGEKIADPISMYNNDILTTPANLAGLPSMSLPLGLDSHNLPIGLQLIAPAFQDDKMVNVAQHIEEIVQFKERPDVI